MEYKRVELDLETVRHQLVLLVKRRKARKLGWPRDWRPTGVTNPRDGRPFTPAGAWDFIAELLERGCAIDLKILDDPEAGARAYVIQETVGDRLLYIKLQLGSGCVIGRSFHYSHHERERESDG